MSNPTKPDLAAIITEVNEKLTGPYGNATDEPDEGAGKPAVTLRPSQWKALLAAASRVAALEKELAELAYNFNRAWSSWKWGIISPGDPALQPSGYFEGAAKTRAGVDLLSGVVTAIAERRQTVPLNETSTGAERAVQKLVQVSDAQVRRVAALEAELAEARNKVSIYKHLCEYANAMRDFNTPEYLEGWRELVRDADKKLDHVAPDPAPEGEGKS